jgi:uncharacterized membrane protein
MSSKTATGTLRYWLLTGGALTIPLLVTLVVLGFVVDFLSGVLDPLVRAARLAPGFAPGVEGIVLELSAVALLLVIVVGVGAVADLTERNYAASFHTAVESVPGVGDLYRSFRRMSDVFVDSDTETFQEVKLVEFPHEGAYSLAFVTADTPGKIQAAAGALQMRTLFVPLAPNPVMGGFLVHFDTDQVYDIDLTVEEAIQAIVTSGVSVELADRDRDRPLSMDELSDLDMDAIDEEFDGDRVGPHDDDQ